MSCSHKPMRRDVSSHLPFTTFPLLDVYTAFQLISTLQLPPTTFNLSSEHCLGSRIAASSIAPAYQMVSSTSRVRHALGARSSGWPRFYSAIASPSRIATEVGSKPDITCLSARSSQDANAVVFQGPASGSDHYHSLQSRDIVTCICDI